MKSSDHSRRNRDRAEAASRYLEERNYECHQRNGQRVSVHKTLVAEQKPGDGPREIFIGKLPRDLFENELLPRIEKAGRVLRMRLMMDFSGSNRGFAFAEYVSSAEANQACKQLNRLTIREGEPPIGVLISFDNRKLSLGNLPPKINREKLCHELDKVITGIQSIQLENCLPNATGRFALVTFETHEAATQARRVLCPGNIKICDRIVTIEWARPEQPCGSPPNQHRQLSRSSPPNNSSVSRGPQPLQQARVPPQHHLARSNQQAAPRISPQQALILSPSPHHPLVACRDSPPLHHQPPLISPLMSPHQHQHQQQHLVLAPRLASPMPSILGEKARQMLAACPPDPHCTTIIDNIDLNLLDASRLKAIFQLITYLTITKMVPCAPTTLEITYQNSNEAKLMTQLLNQFPDSFQRLAVPGKRLLASQMILPDYNANYQCSSSAFSSPSSVDPAFEDQNEILSKAIVGLLNGYTNLILPSSMQALRL